MKNSVKRSAVLVLFILLASLLLTSCAERSDTTSISLDPSEAVYQKARREFRSAAVVLRGICTGTHIDSEGRDCSLVTATEVLAGSLNVGDLIHCPDTSYTEGEEYLLYLTEGEDVYHAEDDEGYEVLNETPLRIVDNEVIWDHERVSYDTIVSEIEQEKSIIAIPAKQYFYRNLSGLVKNSDYIFIGKAESVTEPAEMSLRSEENGTSIEQTAMASLVTVTAYGSVKGSLKYGDEITLVDFRDDASDLLDAGTLRSVERNQDDALPIEKGKLYLFFLCDGTDAKQNYLFPVNVLQGNVLVSDDNITPAAANTAVDEKTLTELVKRLRECLVDSTQEKQPSFRID